MKIKLEKTPSFWAYILGGFISAVVGVMLLPAWSGAELFFSKWGEYSVNIMISALLLAYILLYLMKRIKRYSNTPAQIVAIVELVLMAVLAVVCAVYEFFEYGINFGGPCQILGIALWIRGASGVYTGYYCDSDVVKEAEQKKKEKKNKGEAASEEKTEEVALDTDKAPRGRVDDFTVWRLTLAIVLITAGSYLVLRPAFEKIHLQWVFSCAIIIIACFFIVLGFALKPQKIKVAERGEKAEAPKEASANASEEAKEQSEAAGYLESGKVKINLGGSANAMTKTAAYDAIKDEVEAENLPAVVEEKAEEKPAKSKKKKKE